MNVFEPQISTDLQVASGAGDYRVGTHVAMNADIVAFEERRDVAEVAPIERKIRFELIGCGRGRFQIPVDITSQCSESVSRTIGPGWRSFEADAEFAAAFRGHREIGAIYIERAFSIAEFEIDSSVRDFQCRQGPGSPASGCAQAVDQLDGIPGAITTLDGI